MGGIIQAITEFFESIFNRNSPEVQKRLQIKKLQSVIQSFQPVIFKDGFLLPNFAEAFRLLYKNTKPLSDLFSETIASPDLKKNHRFEAQLIVTGLSKENQDLLSSLSYEARKSEFEDSKNKTSLQIFDQQHRNLDKILNEVSNPSFKKIDKNIMMLHHFSDFCKSNFITVLQIFDPNFISVDLNYVPTFQSISINRLDNAIEDLYFQTAELKLTSSISNAILALAQMRSHGAITTDEKKELEKNIKTIAYILNHFLSPDKLKELIHYCKQDINYTPKFSTYTESAMHSFTELLQNQFKSDEQRIKTEMKDENIRTEVEQLFGTTQLQMLYGYSDETNSRLIKNSQSSFLWILPMQILKTFLSTYFTENVRSLFNDIVIEGFFNNPSYKSDFSTIVYAAFECETMLAEFEDKFNSKNKFSLSIIDSHLKDSRAHPEFLKMLDQLVNEANNEAKHIIEVSTNSLNSLYKHIVDLMADAKKPTSEIISNLKVLMMSSRNRDNTDFLEQNYTKWEIFFQIMKNYVIING